MVVPAAGGRVGLLWLGTRGVLLVVLAPETSPRNYHHHMLLLSGITDLLEERRRREFLTALHKIRVHINIRGNDLAYAAAKMTVTQYNSLPESQN